MELVHFTRRNDGATLRPTHAVRIAADLGALLRPCEGGFVVVGTDLARSARQVREGYRCRTVRKETRRIALLGDDAAQGEIYVGCADADTRHAMTEAAAAAG